jgi:hypothetical protein
MFSMSASTIRRPTGFSRIRAGQSTAAIGGNISRFILAKLDLFLLLT